MKTKKTTETKKSTKGTESTTLPMSIDITIDAETFHKSQGRKTPAEHRGRFIRVRSVMDENGKTTHECKAELLAA
jgi:hypothetical protein